VTQDFILKQFRVSVDGFDSHVYHARSRQKALANAWRDFCSYRDDVDFKAFLRMARAQQEEPDERLGEPIIVGGRPAFYVSHNRQYIRFVRPDTDVILSSHPFDVEPPSARRGTSYYQEQAA